MERGKETTQIAPEDRSGYNLVGLWVSIKDSIFYLPSPFPISASFLPPKCEAAEVNCDKGRCQEEQQ